MENQENQEKKHKRRVRYSGTHPRNYKEKYKELNPEKYADTISKVIKKGGTPAGMHISICVNEILDFFDIDIGSTQIDTSRSVNLALDIDGGSRVQFPVIGCNGISRLSWKNCREKGISMVWM